MVAQIRAQHEPWLLAFCQFWKNKIVISNVLAKPTDIRELRMPAHIPLKAWVLNRLKVSWIIWFGLKAEKQQNSPSLLRKIFRHLQ